MSANLEIQDIFEPTSSGGLAGESAIGTPEKLALITKDETLAAAIERIARTDWSVIRLPLSTRELSNNKLLVVDDELIDEVERRRTLEQFRSRATHTAIIYVANQHSEEIEKSARGSGILLYTAKPIDEQRMRLVLDRLLKYMFQHRISETALIGANRKPSLRQQVKPRLVGPLTLL